MFDDTIPAWWYEDGGRQVGPVTAAALHRLVASGRLSRAHRVWKNGMAAWEPLGQVAELAPMLRAGAAPVPPGFEEPPVLPPPPVAGFPGHEPGSPRPVPSYPGATFEEIPVGVTILLAVVTLGIYGLVKFYQTARAYEQLAGRESKFALWFWLFVGLGVGGIVLNAPLGVPLGLASAVFQVLTLGEVLRVREEGMRRNGIAAPVTSASTHTTLLILAIVLSVIVVGLVFAVIQAVKWFRDWNAIVGAMRGGPRP